MPINSLMVGTPGRIVCSTGAAAVLKKYTDGLETHCRRRVYINCSFELLYDITILFVLFFYSLRLRDNVKGFLTTTVELCGFFSGKIFYKRVPAK